LISSDVLRGHLDAIILRLIVDSDRYGYELFSEIGRQTHERLQIKEATLYAVLQRLERQGYISSYQGEISGGSKRRYYHITASGRFFLRQKSDEWRETKEIINIFMEDEVL
jgi:PadR family transcriptional regulator PadR